MLIRIFICICIGFAAYSSSAQVNVQGEVTDSDGKPIKGVHIRIQPSPYEAVTDDEGRYELNQLPLPKGFSFTVHYSHLAHEAAVDSFTVSDLDEQFTLYKTLVDKYYTLATVPVIVPSVDYAPFHTVSLSGKTLQLQNLGQDMPFLLRRTPSAVVTSDAGTGFGYTGLRIRGSDNSRTNVTINGVALNDSESQGVFWVDLPNLAASVKQVRIQRGVGNSTNGAGAFGAGVHISTLPSSAVNPYIELQGGLGSFNTKRFSVAGGASVPNQRWSFEGRFTHILSDGYIDRASAELTSAMGTISYWGANSSLHLFVMSGRERTYQAWFGVPAQYVNDSELRTYNPAGPKADGSFYDDQVDDYDQDHLQLHWQKSLASQADLHVAAHYTRGKGFFEEYIQKFAQFGNDDFYSFYGLENPIVNGDTLMQSNMVRRRWLDNDFFGIVATAEADVDIAQITVGAAANHYIGSHYGELIEAEFVSDTELPRRYYEADADKSDANAFLKASIPIEEGLFGFLDLQYRYVYYDWETVDNSISNVNTYHFFNPKIGLTFRPDNRSRWYASYAIGQREPSRSDFLASPVDMPERELLHDFELGFEQFLDRFSFNANAFYMRYQDQLVPTGAVNIDALPIRENVPNSYRLGLELSGYYQVNDPFAISGSVAWSRNRIDVFTEKIFNYDTGENALVEHENTPIAYSPELIANVELTYDFMRSKEQVLELALMPKYVSEQHIDNTGNDATVLEAYTFTDVRLRYEMSPTFADMLSIQLLVRNVFDATYSANAWTSRFISSFDPTSSDPYAQSESGDTYNSTGFFPQAGRNFLLGLTLRF